MELCKDIFRKTSSVLVPERHPNQTLLHAFYNFALMIGYALEMADDLQEFADAAHGHFQNYAFLSGERTDSVAWKAWTACACFS